MEEFNEKGQVICQECGKAYNQLTVQHVKMHGMSFEDYKNKYPNLSTVSKSFSAKQKLRNTKVFNEDDNKNNKLEKETSFKEITSEEEIELLGVPQEEIKIEDFGDVDIDKIPPVPKDYIEKVSNFIEEVKTVVNGSLSIKHYPNPNNSIHKDKIKFLDFLLSYFSDYHFIENSYFVNKLSAGGKVDERIITDISIPTMKLDIEFPNTFWHNIDMPKSLRDSKLKTIGWTIIDIPGPKPTIGQLKEALKKLNLIC